MTTMNTMPNGAIGLPRKVLSAAWPAGWPAEFAGRALPTAPAQLIEL